MAICTLKDNKISECNENSIRDLNNDKQLTEVSNLWGKYKKEKTKQICGGGGTTSSAGTSTNEKNTNDAATQTTDTILEDAGITNNDEKTKVLALIKGIPDSTEITITTVDSHLEKKNIPKILETMEPAARLALFNKLRKLVREDQLAAAATTDEGTTDNSMKIAALKELEWTAFAELMKEKKIFEGEESEWKIKKDEWGEGKNDEVQKKRAILLTNASIGTIRGGRRRRGGRRSRRRKKKSKRRKSKRKKKSKRRKSRKKRSKRRKSRRRR